MATSDIEAVNALQKQFAIAPLSQWPKGAVRSATPVARRTDQAAETLR